MKKILSLLLASLLVVLLLASCTETPDNSEKQDSDDKKEVVDLANDAYVYSYSSNGDGTCSISGIGTLNYDKANKVLTIPEKSPTGETVVSIEKLNMGKFPTYLILEDYNSMVETIKAHPEIVSEYKFKKSIEILFTTISLDNAILTESAKQEYIRKYPIIQYTDIVVISSDVSDREIDVLCGYLNDCGISVAEYVKHLNSMNYEKGYSNFYLYSTDIESLSLPSTLTSIGSNAFAGFASLKSVTIPDSVTYFGECAFNGCASLTDITLGKGVTEIEDYMFKGCTSLKNITLAEGVTYIGAFAFEGCTALESITLPSTITEIGSCAFSGCTALTSANYLGTVDSWAMVTLNDDTSAPFALTGGLVINGQLVTEVNLQTATKVSSYAFANCTAITKVTLGNSVKTIGDYAFYQCTGIENLTLSNNIKSLGNSAFEGCVKITSFTSPTSLTMIRLRAFAGCTALATVTLGENVTTIGYSAFSNTPITTIVIPNSVTSLGYSAFNNCENLVSVVLPKSVKTLGTGVFFGCMKLTTINYRGSAEEWAEIDFADGWMDLARAAHFQAGAGVVFNYNK